MIECLDLCRLWFKVLLWFSFYDFAIWMPLISCQSALSKLLSDCVLSSSQPPILSGVVNE